jgi:hypothetical protein
MDESRGFRGVTEDDVRGGTLMDANQTLIRQRVRLGERADAAGCRAYEEWFFRAMIKYGETQGIRGIRLWGST